MELEKQRLELLRIRDCIMALELHSFWYCCQVPMAFSMACFTLSALEVRRIGVSPIIYAWS